MQRACDWGKGAVDKGEMRNLPSSELITAVLTFVGTVSGVFITIDFTSIHSGG